MSKIKKIILGVLLLLLVATILTGCGEKNMHPTRQSLNFLGHKNVHELILTIYYMNPSALTVIPLSVDDLIRNSEYRIVVSGSILRDYIDLLNRLGNTVLVPVEQESYLNTRLYYVFETEQNGKIFDVAMWGGENNSIFVNEVEVEGTAIFYDVIKPFLPEAVAKDFEDYVARI